MIFGFVLLWCTTLFCLWPGLAGVADMVSPCLASAVDLIALPLLCLFWHARLLRWMNGGSRASVVCRDLSVFENNVLFWIVLMSSAYPDLYDLCAPWYSIGLDGLDISKCKVASFGHWCCHPGANCSIRVWFRISSCHLDHLVLQAKGFPSIGLYAISMHIFACFCKFFSASFDLWRHLGRKRLHHDDQVVAWMQFLRLWLHDHYSTSCNPLKRPKH